MSPKLNCTSVKASQRVRQVTSNGNKTMDSIIGPKNTLKRVGNIRLKSLKLKKCTLVLHEYHVNVHERTEEHAMTVNLFFINHITVSGMDLESLHLHLKLLIFFFFFLKRMQSRCVVAISLRMQSGCGKVTP